MRIHFVHPKFLSDALLEEEHDFLHRLFDALSEGEKGSIDHPDLFRYRGRRGQLYIRHRKIAEELGIRGLPHETFFDRRNIEPEEWEEPGSPGCGSRQGDIAGNGEPRGYRLPEGDLFGHPGQIGGGYPEGTVEDLPVRGYGAILWALSVTDGPGPRAGEGVGLDAL